MSASLNLVRKLSRSPVYLDFESAFGKSTDLPIELTSRDREPADEYAHSKCSNPICVLLAGTSQACSVCALHGLKNYPSLSQTQTETCLVGLTTTCIPLRLDGIDAAWLRTAPVFLQTSTMHRFQRLLERLTNLGAKIAAHDLQSAYFASRVISPSLYQAIVRLLEIYADYLGLIAGQIVLEGRDSVIVERARQYVADHQTDRITLVEVARAANVSTFHFCRTFKQSTGLTFTEYLNRFRVERAKGLLRDNRLRISEVAYEAGFQTITHFNRVFRRLVGCSPTVYRSR